jgi:signal transduction histidine kinase
VLTAIRDPRGQVTGFVKVLRNRTESHGETVLLENRIRALEEADARKGIFLATLVHELRGPLAPLMNAMMIVQGQASSNPDLAFPYKILARQISLLSRLVGDLTEMIRLGSGKMELARESIDLNQSVQLAVETCLDQVRTRQQQLEALLPEPPTLIPADPGRIQQVLVNLITNASKYTPAGGHIWVKVTAKARRR